MIFDIFLQMIRHALQDDRTDIIDTWLQRGGNIDVVSKSSGSMLHSVYLGSAQYCENIEFLLQRGTVNFLSLQRDIIQW